MTEQPTLNEPNQFDKFVNDKVNVINEYLQAMVEEEMRSQNLDPLNKEDVKKYWALKGILD